MAEEGLVPAFFSYKLPRLETPLVAIGLQVLSLLALLALLVQLPCLGTPLVAIGLQASSLRPHTLVA